VQACVAQLLGVAQQQQQQQQPAAAAAIEGRSAEAAAGAAARAWLAAVEGRCEWAVWALDQGWVALGGLCAWWGGLQALRCAWRRAYGATAPGRGLGSRL
jgi:hypothetical protein